jgi:hypothetical protein
MTGSCASSSDGVPLNMPVRESVTLERRGSDYYVMLDVHVSLSGQLYAVVL